MVEGTSRIVARAIVTATGGASAACAAPDSPCLVWPTWRVCCVSVRVHADVNNRAQSSAPTAILSAVNLSARDEDGISSETFPFYFNKRRCLTVPGYSFLRTNLKREREQYLRVCPLRPVKSLRERNRIITGKRARE